MNTKTAKILIVEDEPVVRLHLKACLSQLGYQMLPPVSSCFDALNSFKYETPDLVLMDIFIEGELDGVDAAKQIHQRFGVPVVFLTAHTDEETLNRARLCQPHGYIVKPFREEDLKSTIEIVLFNYQQEKILKEHLNFSSSLLDSIEYPVMAVDCSENIIFLNSKILSLLDKEEFQIFGKEFSKTVPLFSENGDKVDVPFDRILVKGEAEELNDIVLKVSNEKTRLVDIVISPFKKLPSKTIGSVLIFKDVTDKSMSREEKEKFLEHLINILEDPAKND